MKAIHLKRLTVLAKHLRKKRLGHVKFKFNVLHKNSTAPSGYCGTAGCALGECPVAFPKDWHFSDVGHWNGKVPVLINGDDVWDDAQDFFGVSSEEVDHLFDPGDQVKTWMDIVRKGKTLAGKATPKEVSDNILHFVKLKRYGII